MSGDAASAVTSAAISRRASRLSRSERRFALATMMPATLFLAVFVGWPLVRLVIDSLYEIAPLQGTRLFIGLQNFRDALGLAQFRDAARRTLVYTVLVVSLEFLLGLTAALLFNAIGQRSRWLRTVFLYPLMIAPLVAGLLWRYLLIDNFGLLNELLSRAHIIDSPASISWLSDPDIALYSVAIPDIWLTTSFMTLVLFAGLQNIPPELLEAARIDGAGPLQLLIRVVLPLLRPVIAVALIIRGIDATRAFDVILIQTDGGPQNATETLSLQIYRTMIRFSQPGLASAMSVLYLAAMLVVAAIALRFIWRPSGAR